MTRVSFMLVRTSPAPLAPSPVGAVASRTVAHLTAAHLLDDVDPGWARALAPATDALDRVAAFLVAEERAGHQVLPPRADIMRAFRRPFDDVRVLVVGQDPYPTPGHAHGLAFSVDRHVRPLPRSLRNVLTELHDDVGLLPPPDGDLSAWADQGVLLLNRVLTVRAGEAGSHRGHGWEEVTEVAVDALAARPAPLVGVLWGADAARLAPRLAPHPVLTSAHPSPLSARRGFFGSHPFSAVDAHLRAAGSAPVDWTLAHEQRETLL